MKFLFVMGYVTEFNLTSVQKQSRFTKLCRNIIQNLNDTTLNIENSF